MLCRVFVNDNHRTDLGGIVVTPKDPNGLLLGISIPCQGNQYTQCDNELSRNMRHRICETHY